MRKARVPLLAGLALAALLLLLATPLLGLAQAVPVFERAWALDVEDHTLVRPNSVVLDAAGSVWIADPGGEGLVRWDREGDLRGRVGRGGEGPGEYRGTTLIMPRADGGVLLYDFATPQVLEFDEDGDFVRSEAGFQGVTRDVMFEAEGFGFDDVSGDLILWTESNHTARERSFEGYGRLLLLRGDGTGASELERVPLGPVVKERDQLNVMSWFVPHTDGPLRAFLPQGGWIEGSARGDTLRIVSSEGELERTVPLGLSDRPVTRADRAAGVFPLRDAFNSELLVTRQNLTEEIETFLREKAERLFEQVEEEIPDTASRLSLLAAGSDGTVWALQTPLVSEGAATWLRVDPEEARVTCRVRTEEHRGHVVSASGTSHALAVIEMEEGQFPRIVKLELPDGACASVPSSRGTDRGGT